MKESRVGNVAVNSTGNQMEIVHYGSSSDIWVRFLDNYGATVHTTYSNFQKGQVKNPYYPSVCGVGFIGQGPHKTKCDGKHTTPYMIWATLLQRCYSSKWAKMFPAYYESATVCEEWKNYQNFASWYEANKYSVPARLHLDKDILFPNNTIYSPETCLLVPQRLNMLFCGKEKVGQKYAKHVIEITNQYKNIIPANVYDALLRRAELIAKKG